MRLTFAMLAIGLATLAPARAQSPEWQIYKPDGGGFSIKMPGKPDLKTEQRNGRPTYSALVGIDKSIAGADLVFLVKYQASEKTPGPETEAILAKVIAALAEGGKVLSQKTEMLGSYPAVRFAVEDADKDTSEMRAVITDRYFIQAIFLGPIGNPLGKGFLDSFSITAP